MHFDSFEIFSGKTVYRIAFEGQTLATLIMGNKYTEKTKRRRRNQKLKRAKASIQQSKEIESGTQTTKPVRKTLPTQARGVPSKDLKTIRRERDRHRNLLPPHSDSSYTSSDSESETANAILLSYRLDRTGTSGLPSGFESKGTPEVAVKAEEGSRESLSAIQSLPAKKEPFSSSSPPVVPPRAAEVVRVTGNATSNSSIVPRCYPVAIPPYSSGASLHVVDTHLSDMEDQPSDITPPPLLGTSCSPVFEQQERQLQGTILGRNFNYGPPSLLVTVVPYSLICYRCGHPVGSQNCENCSHSNCPACVAGGHGGPWSVTVKWPCGTVETYES